VIELVYRIAEACGLALWCQDEAGPSATRPQPGESWQPEGRPMSDRYPPLRMILVWGNLAGHRNFKLMQRLLFECVEISSPRRIY